MFALTALLPGLAAPAQAQTLPPSLTGEFFLAAPLFFAEHEATTEANCTATGGTITYSVSGEAIGPYPGTFQESGTVTLGPPGPFPDFPLARPMLSFDATFTIDSLTGDVTGRKSMRPGAFNAGVCDLGGVFAGFPVFFASVSYVAHIVSPLGEAEDRGRGTAALGAACQLLSCSSVFSEDFVSESLLPLDTTGKATGGGQLGAVMSPTHVTLGFEVKEPEAGKLQGRCLVNDSASNTRVKCLTVTDYQQIGNSATWEGEAEVNGNRENYRITVQDNGEPNQGIDTFAFESESYDVAGNVQRGNIQVHKQKVAAP